MVQTALTCMAWMNASSAARARAGWWVVVAACRACSAEIPRLVLHRAGRQCIDFRPVAAPVHSCAYSSGGKTASPSRSA